MDAVDWISGRVEIEEVVADEPELDTLEVLLALSWLARRAELCAEKVEVASYSARSRSRSTVSIVAVSHYQDSGAGRGDLFGC